MATPCDQALQFLSTPSARRATQRRRAARRARQISIHALREEGDPLSFPWEYGPAEFLSTPSARRATQLVFCFIHQIVISIHALREEGDLCRTCRVIVRDLFLSTPSARRATRRAGSMPAVRTNFYPRPPRGGRLLPGADRGGPWAISIHALREEGDPSGAVHRPGHCDFYPRPPRGGRQQKQRQNLYFQTNYTTFCTNLEEP